MNERTLPDANGAQIHEGDTVIWLDEQCEVVYVNVSYGLISVAHDNGIQPVAPEKVVKVRK